MKNKAALLPLGEGLLHPVRLYFKSFGIQLRLELPSNLTHKHAAAAGPALSTSSAAGCALQTNEYPHHNFCV